MLKHLTMICALLPLCSCQMPQDREALRPLPEDGRPVSYAELLTRARQQATVATEAFYKDRWPDLEDAAKAMQQTARMLPRADDVPAKHKEALPMVSSDLSKDATSLLQAVQAKDEKEVNDTLKRINLAVRKLRLDQ